MSHLEQRLQADLDDIGSGIAEIGRDVRTSLKNAIRSLVIGDADLAGETILGDLKINRSVRALDRKCHAFVAVHLPSAGHLRYVSSVLRLNVALERVGDYAVTICREVVQLAQEPPAEVLRDVDLVGDQVREVLKQSMLAFNDRNAELARGTIGMTNQIEATFHKVFEDLVAAGKTGSRPIEDLFGLLVVINRLGRVGSQAKNICEETIYAVTGETKAPKVYRVLFVDSKNTGASRIAEAYAQKAFPESGRYDSAGWDAGETSDPRVGIFLEKKGISLSEAGPVALSSRADDLNNYHVIVALDEGVREHLPAVPFRTILLSWKIDQIDTELDQQRFEASLDGLFGEIRSRVRDLVERLRGEGAE